MILPRFRCKSSRLLPVSSRPVDGRCEQVSVHSFVPPDVKDVWSRVGSKGSDVRRGSDTVSSVSGEMNFES